MLVSVPSVVFMPSLHSHSCCNGPPEGSLHEQSSSEFVTFDPVSLMSPSPITAASTTSSTPSHSTTEAASVSFNELGPMKNEGLCLVLLEVYSFDD